MIIIFERERFKRHPDTSLIDLEQWTILVVFLVFLTIALIATYYAFKKIIRPGVSREIRKQVMRRHILYIAIISVTFVLYGYKILIEDVFGRQNPNWLDFTANILFAAQGVFLAVLRLSEPLIWKTFKDKFLSVCCCRRDLDEAQQEEIETLNTFLATSFNVELVYIILKAITKFSKELIILEGGEMSKTIKESKV